MERLHQFTRILILISGPLMFILMMLIPLNWDALFRDQTITNAAELFILLGLAILIFLDILLIVFSLLRQGEFIVPRAHSGILAIASFIALAMLAMVKVMTDEIARETALGWEVRGEFIMLISALLVHLAFNLYLMSNLRPLPEEKSTPES